MHVHAYIPLYKPERELLQSDSGKNGAAFINSELPSTVSDRLTIVRKLEKPEGEDAHNIQVSEGSGFKQQS